jgi:hypothetical protein
MPSAAYHTVRPGGSAIATARPGWPLPRKVTPGTPPPGGRVSTMLSHSLRECERFYNSRRPEQAMAYTRPLRPSLLSVTDPAQIARLGIRRHRP